MYSQCRICQAESTMGHWSKQNPLCSMVSAWYLILVLALQIVLIVLIVLSVLKVFTSQGRISHVHNKHTNKYNQPMEDLLACLSSPSLVWQRTQQYKTMKWRTMCGIISDSGMTGLALVNKHWIVSVVHWTLITQNSKLYCNISY